MFFSGYFENGYREGRGQEYDRNGRLISDGYYSKGKKHTDISLNEMDKGFRKEYDENGELIRICQKDDFGNYEGYCYLFNSGKISRVSFWKKGKETELMKQFRDNVMIEYKNGSKVYKGGFLDSIELDYPRSGKGVEYGKDGKARIFQGNYTFDKRHGKGSEIRNGLATKERKWIMGHKSSVFWCIEALIVICVILMTIVYIVDAVIGITLLLFLTILIMIRWKHNQKTRNTKGESHELDFVSAMIYAKLLHIKGGKKKGKGDKKQSYYNTLDRINQILIFIFLIFIVLGVCGTFIQNFFLNPYTSLFSTYYEFDSSKYVYPKWFILWYRPFLKTISIGDYDYKEVSFFSINRLPSLKSITIGSHSFSKNPCGNRDQSKSFHVTNCKSLESIQIGDYSFENYLGEFELKNLPQLQSIQIGINNFYHNSFVIRGIGMILNI